MPPRRPERPRSARLLRARPQAEPLEGRSLLSHVSPHSAAQTLAIHVPGALIGPDTSEVDVIVTRSSSAGAAALRRRLPVGYFGDDLTPTPTDLAAPGRASAPHPPYRDVMKRLRFKPGQASLTIPLHVLAVPAGLGSFKVVVGVTQPSSPFGNWPTTTTFRVFASADKIPPTIAATRLTPAGLAPTFSQPMDASTVQDINNYDVTIPPTTAEIMSRVRAGRHPTTPPPPAPVALQAAVYAPTTETVTLIPTGPPDLIIYNVDISGSVGTLPSTTPGTQVLTDLKGNALTGYLSVPVGPDPWAPYRGQ
jgi:hypothetical protein